MTESGTGISNAGSVKIFIEKKKFVVILLYSVVMSFQEVYFFNYCLAC